MSDTGLNFGYIPLRDGLRLRAGTAGDGEPILLVHGFTGSIEAWGATVLSGLAATHRLIAVDLLGHGASDTPSDPRRYALPEVIQDLVSVLDCFEAQRPAWIGYSMGGRVALGAAIERPERVGCLVLESASPGLESEADRIARRKSDATLAQHILTRGIEDFVGYWSNLPLFASQKRLPDWIRGAIGERRKRNSPQGLAACLVGLGTGSQPSFWNQLQEFRPPMLLISGKEDPKFTAIASRMATIAPNSSACVIEDAGHTVHLECPEKWLQAVREHL